MADGVCQGCEENAPFVNKRSEPFLEVHHLTRRNDGGPDDPKTLSPSVLTVTGEFTKVATAMSSIKN